MIDNTIFDKINAASEMYSFRGDRSLEYLGIEFDSGGDVSCRVYRCCKNHFDINHAAVPQEIKAFNNSVLDSNPNLRFVDYSFRDNDYYSLSYDYLNGNDIDPSDTDTHRVSETIGSGVGLSRNPCFQIGYLLDRRGNVEEVKRYFNIIQSSDFCRTVNKLEFVSNNKDKYLSLFIKLFDNMDSSVIEDILSKSLDSFYYPFMLGMNKRSDHIELKQYYIIGRSMKRKEANDIFLNFADRFISHDSLHNIVGVCSDNQLYVRGYAVSFENGQFKWRLYFYPMKY